MSAIATLDAAGELRAQVRGAVIRQTDPGSTEGREVFNAMHPSSAAIALRCTGTADVIAGTSMPCEPSATKTRS
jgi:hypothetical protein